MKLLKKFARRGIFTAAVLIFLLFQAFAARNYSQSHRLGDEVGHWVAGHFMTKGLKPYKDLQLNHQPLVYLFSAAAERLTQPTSLYTYIGRQRMSIFVYSVIWQIIYFLTFGLSGFFFSVIFEIIKYSHAGYNLLGETLAVYPLVYMFGVIATPTFLNKTLRRSRLILFSVSSFMVVFSLAPLWPSAALLNLILFLSVKRKNDRILLLGPFLGLTALLFFYLPFNTYVKETVVYNLTYLMPVLDRVKTVDGYLKMIFLPFTALFSLTDVNSQIVSFFLIIYAFLTYHFWRRRKIVIWVIILVALTLSNLRAAEINNNFHLLPYLATYIFLDVYLLLNKVSLRVGTGLLLVFTVWLYFTSFNPLFRCQNLQTEHHNNYVQSQRYGGAVAAIKDGNDRLLSLPYDPLVYWVASVKLAVRVLEYYSWIYAIPEYRRELKTVFEKNPPEFVVDAGLDEDGSVDRFVLNQLAEKYVRTSHLASPSNLYILKTKIPEIKKEQWDDFAYLLFEKSSSPQ